MAHFYLTANNTNGNPVTAAGSRSGQYAHLRGWDVGVRVEARHAADTKADFFDLYATSVPTAETSNTSVP